MIEALFPLEQNPRRVRPKKGGKMGILLTVFAKKIMAKRYRTNHFSVSLSPKISEGVKWFRRAKCLPVEPRIMWKTAGQLPALCELPLPNNKDDDDDDDDDDNDDINENEHNNNGNDDINENENNIGFSRPISTKFHSI